MRIRNYLVVVRPIQAIFFLLTTALLSIVCTNTGKSQVKSTTAATSAIVTTATDTGSLLKYTAGIRAILHDSKGNYWFGSHSEGVCLFDGKTFTYFTIEDGLSNNQVRTIQEHKNGSIWFGTGNGVSSWDGATIINQTLSTTFLAYRRKVDEGEGFSMDDLWFNDGDTAGVYRYNGKELTYLPFRGNEDIQASLWGVTAVSKGLDSVVWFATYGSAIGYDGDNFEIIEDKSLGFAEAEIPGTTPREYLHVRSILSDSKGRLWIGNNGIGVLLRENGKTVNFSDQQGLNASAGDWAGDTFALRRLKHVFAIMEDKQGNIWFGDRDTGAWMHDGKSTTNFPINDKLPSKHVWQFYEDHNGDVLAAMGDGGVYRFEGGGFERVY